MRFDLVPHSAIEPDPENVRQYFSPGSINELADSIHEYGLLENLVVREGEGGRFYIVAGERRWRALGELVRRGERKDSDEVPVTVIDGKGTFENLVENLSREDVPPWELGFRFNELSEAGYTQREIGTRIGKSQGFVSRHSYVARGLHPASVDRLNKMHSKLGINDLMRVASLTTADKKPDEKSQRKLLDELAGIKGHRKRKRAKRTNVEKMVRRLHHLRHEMKIPEHARPYADVIVNYLYGEIKGRTIPWPEEL